MQRRLNAAEFKVQNDIIALQKCSNSNLSHRQQAFLQNEKCLAINDSYLLMLTIISHQAPLLASRAFGPRLAGVRFARRVTINEIPVTYERKFHIKTLFLCAHTLV